MAAGESVHLSLEERRARGGQARQEVPLSSAAGWRPAADRADPVSLLEAQDRPGSRIWCRSGMAG